MCPGFGATDPAPIRVSFAAITAQYDLSFRPARYHLWATAGPAVIRHSGIGYDQPQTPTSLGGAFGLALTAPLAWHLDWMASAGGVGYWFNLNFPQQYGPQLDALLSAGVRWHL